MAYIELMKIGEVTIKSPVVMAPIAGMTDLPYRRIVMEYGAGMTVSELISANALVRDSKKTFAMLPAPDEPRPVAAQIFGGEPEIVRDAAVIVDESGCCDIIDINFGCPVKKVTKTGAGAAMLRDMAKAERTVREVVRAVKRPVTVKTRIGWDSSSIYAVEFLRAMEGAGVRAVALHGRTAAQGYSGAADWDVISKAARALSIPVIGNGDIDSPETAVSRLESSGAAAVMIGRGALGAPWIFRQTGELLNTGSYSPVSIGERKDVILRHMEMTTSRYGQRAGIRMFRAHIGCYSRNLPGSARFRGLVNAAASAGELRLIVDEFFSGLRGMEHGAAAGCRGF